MRKGSLRNQAKIGSVVESMKYAVLPRDCGATQLIKILTIISKESMRKKMSTVLARIATS